MVSGDEAVVPTTWIQPIGLIVNELLTNGTKRGGASLVEFRVTAQRYRLTVSDEGEGFPADHDAELSASLGMKVLKALVAQLGGELGIGRNPAGRGACAVVAWSADP